MKNAIAILLVSTICSPAFAADTAVDTCTAKINELERLHSTDGAMISGGKPEEFRTHLKNAKEAQKEGDLQACNASAERAKIIYDSARSK
jgi:hypothetical protein